MFGTFRAANCQCEPNANPFVQEWFSECIYTTWEFAAFCIGMSSVMFWIVAQLPQFISNWRNQSAEALSPWFLAQWLAGDSFNLLGCLLTGNQLATETFTATYFIFADCIIISQYIYYNMRAKEELVFSEEGKASLTKPQSRDLKKPLNGAMAEFQKRLAKITIVVPDEGEGSEPEHQKSQHYHPVTFVAGRSGASMIAHAMHSPRTPLSLEQHSTCNPPAIAPKFPDSHISARYGLEGGTTKVRNFGGDFSHAKREAPKSALRAFQDQGGQFQTREERNLSLEERRRSAERLGTLPEIDIERLFPTTNAMKRHLRMLMNQYGLDCGPPSASRVTIHHAKSLRPPKRAGRAVTEKSRLWPGLKNRPVKGAAGLSVLLTLVTATDYFQTPGMLGASRSVGIGSRRLLMERPGPGAALETSTFVRVGRKLLLTCGEGNRPGWVKAIGTGIGWGSAGFYLGSRISQLAMNYQRRSAEGLSLAMLSCAILANTSMGLSIIMRAKSLEDLTSKAPWILGSIGTVSLDVFILLQAKYLDVWYRTRSTKVVKNEHTPLLA